MVRKAGKLPGTTKSLSYEMEYAQNTIEVQTDCVKAGQRVVILDDVLASGGTAAAAVQLLREVGADVQGAAFLLELSKLNGRSKIHLPYYTLMTL
jgi:adenine phosphoribosyltransferase